MLAKNELNLTIADGVEGVLERSKKERGNQEPREDRYHLCIDRACLILKDRLVEKTLDVRRLLF